MTIVSHFLGYQRRAFRRVRDAEILVLIYAIGLTNIFSVT